MFLAGEAGIGKSRLLQALAEATAGDATNRLVFQCSALHRENPFWPVSQQLPAVRSLLDYMANRAARHDTRRQRAEVDAMAAQIIAAAGNGSALVVCDDAQWADPATIEVLLRVALAEHPLLLIIASRSEGEPDLGGVENMLRLSLFRL